MSASLVGSEMCIRDSPLSPRRRPAPHGGGAQSLGRGPGAIAWVSTSAYRIPTSPQQALQALAVVCSGLKRFSAVCSGWRRCAAVCGGLQRFVAWPPR
eukprot:7777930-Alexandrium_andersonii.AAC.1